MALAVFTPASRIVVRSSSATSSSVKFQFVLHQPFCELTAGIGCNFLKPVGFAVVCIVADTFNDQRLGARLCAEVRNKE